MLTRHQATVLLAALCEDSGDLRDSVNQEVDGLDEAVTALEAQAGPFRDERVKAILRAVKSNEGRTLSPPETRRIESLIKQLES